MEILRMWPSFAQRIREKILGSFGLVTQDFLREMGYADSVGASYSKGLQDSILSL